MTAVIPKNARTLILLGLLAYVPVSRGADLVALSPQTWDRYIPQGKEVDGIYGDFAMVNDRIMAVIAHPKRGRNANMTVRDVGGCLIDLTRRDRQSDQLSAFYPGASARDLKFGGIEVEAPTTYEVAELDRVFVRARKVTLRLVASPREKEPDVEVAYTLEDGSPSILVTTTFTNRRAPVVDAELLDAIRADRTFEHGPEGPAGLFWAYDKHFGQAYGVFAAGHQILGTTARQLLLRYRNSEGKVAVRLTRGESFRLARHIIPGANLFEVRRVADQIAGKNERVVQLSVLDPPGRPVAGAEVVLARDGRPFSWGRTDVRGQLALAPGDVPGTLTVSALGRGSKSISVGPDSLAALSVELPEPGRVAARITDDRGQPIPCKVQFIGRDGTQSPDFGPDSGEHAVGNLYYSHDGQFRRDLAPGSYDVIVSYGPEYDAVFTQVNVEQGKESPLEARLVRSVKTDGWISADFHSHASPSGDNTSSQLGRVLNLLCEHVEFAPCTEHNRLSTYEPHLKRLGAEARMGTCVGIELTGRPLPLNHQNAFPLVMRPNTQDGGGPTADDDPAIQIERLALWDGASEKLVQVNHPDHRLDVSRPERRRHPGLGLFGHVRPHGRDRGAPAPHDFRRSDHQAGRERAEQPDRQLAPTPQPGPANPGSGEHRRTLQLPRVGVVAELPQESDRQPGRDPDARRGPCRRARALDHDERAFPGGGAPGDGRIRVLGDPRQRPRDLGRQGTLRVRVQCPNWFDVDRVQVFLNGRPSESLNFTRQSAPKKFAAGRMKFDQEIPVHFDRDTHLIVAVIGEHSRLGLVMGPEHANEQPVAVSNPIFVDVDGGGFKADGNPLGKLPVKGGE